MCSLVFAVLPAGAFAERASSPEVLGNITLDIDKDGKLDRAALVENNVDSAYVDLYLYLGGGGDALDLSRKPTVIKRHLISGHVYDMGSNSKSSLLVSGGCGGCTNDYETKLTIVYQGGKFLIGGFSEDWDLRDEGIGSCDINYLTGKGVVSHGLPERNKPIWATFKPVTLADWSETSAPKGCQP